MLTENVLALSFSKAIGMRHTIKFLLLASILAGLTVACASTIQSTSSDPVVSNTVVQAPELLPKQEPLAISPQTHLPGHNFGDINGIVDSGARQRTDPPPFVYWVNGQMVVRRSELGPLTEPVENSLPAVAAHGPGHDLGAINGAFDPGKSLCVPQPKFTYIFNGITIVRRSELGPLTETVDNCPNSYPLK